MTITTHSLKSWRVRLAGVALTLLGLASVGTAQARDLVWSVGVHSPGVSVGLGNAAPVVVASGPVYYAPPPVVYAPRPVYHAAPVVVVPGHRGYYKAHNKSHHRAHHRAHKHHHKHHAKKHGHSHHRHGGHHGHR